jgi:four helix bundle protein
MLIAIECTLQLIHLLRPIVDVLQIRAPYLADQLTRAASGVHLQLAEGSGRTGRDQKNRYRCAAAEAQEVKAALAQVRAWGHVAENLLAPAEALAHRIGGLTFGLAR